MRESNVWVNIINIVYTDVLKYYISIILLN